MLHLPAPIAYGTGWKAIAIDYPLAPYADSEKTAHPAHTAAFEVYKELLNSYKPSQIAFFGDSAGGGMAIAVALMAKDANMPLPGAIVAYDPWIDLEQKTESYSNQEVIDQTIVLTPKNLDSARDAAFGIDCPDRYALPYVSPINGKFDEFPPVAIFAAERDLLKEEGKILLQKLRDSSVDTMYDCGSGLWHGYQEHYELPELYRADCKHVLQYNGIERVLSRSI